MAGEDRTPAYTSTFRSKQTFFLLMYALHCVFNRLMRSPGV